MATDRNWRRLLVGALLVSLSVGGYVLCHRVLQIDTCLDRGGSGIPRNDGARTARSRRRVVFVTVHEGPHASRAGVWQ
jgi:hypothetical protein